MASSEVEAFFGRDPLHGEDALQALVSRMGSRAIEVVVPFEGGYGCGSVQVEERLKSLGQQLGPEIVPHLLRVLNEAPWSSKISATPCFSGIPPNDAIVSPVVDILKRGGDFDAERMAVETLGYLGASGWASFLRRYAMTGVWESELTRFGSDDEHVSRYPFGKLAFYVLEAFARFVARGDEHTGWVHFRELTDFAQLFDRELPSGLSSATLIKRHAHEFTGKSVDLLVNEWLRGTDAKLQELAADLLGNVASVRVARPLLDLATSLASSSSLRTSASIALGEIRHPTAARLLAEALRNPSTPKQHLDWAFSSLYAVPIDWSGTEGYVEEVLSGCEEPAAQLHYSLALRGDGRGRVALESGLDAASPYQRWSSALSLSRLLGPKGRELLEHRGEDASDSVERCAMFAALVRCGDHSKVKLLHESLQEASSLSLLRGVWKVDILDAFRHVATFDNRAFGLWRIAARLAAREVQYFDALRCQDPVASVSVLGGGESSAPAVRAVAPPKLFVSYSHADSAWLERFQLALAPLIRNQRLELWADTLIVPGKWRSQINDALSNASAALFLVSTRFLASDFIMKHELPDLLRLAEQKGVRIFWVLLEDCLWEESGLAEYQGENTGQPLSAMSEAKQKSLIVKTCRRLRDLLHAT